MRRPPKPTANQSAGVTGAIIALLGALHVPDALGLTGDEMAVIVGSLATIAAAGRAALMRRERGRELRNPHAMEETPQP